MPLELASRIELYAAMVESLPRYDEKIEVVNLFVTRELIENDLVAGVALSAAEHDRLDRADRDLVNLRRALLRRFPGLFSARAPDIPRQYWWWFLDEGPQVRQEALATQRA